MYEALIKHTTALHVHGTTHLHSPAEGLVVVVVRQGVVAVPPHGGPTGREDQAAVTVGGRQGVLVQKEWNFYDVVGQD